MKALNADERYFASRLRMYSATAPAPIGTQNYQTPSFVQIKAQTTGGTGPYPAAFPGNNVAGNLILVHMMIDLTQIGANNPNLFVKVSDTQLNSYVQLGPAGTLYSWASGNQHGHSSALFLAQNIKSGPNTVTVTITLGATGSILSGSLKVGEYTANGGIGTTDLQTLAFTASNPSPLGPTVTTILPNQKVLYLNNSGNVNVPPGVIARATGWNEFSIAAPITQAYTSTTNSDNQVWGVAF